MIKYLFYFLNVGYCLISLLILFWETVLNKRRKNLMKIYTINFIFDLFLNFLIQIHWSLTIITFIKLIHYWFILFLIFIILFLIFFCFWICFCLWYYIILFLLFSHLIFKQKIVNNVIRSSASINIILCIWCILKICLILLIIIYTIYRWIKILI